MLATTLSHGPEVIAAPVPQLDGLPLGQVVQRSLQGDPTQRYFTYVPQKGGQGARLIVSVHGISRNAEENAVGFARRAERYGVVLVAPLFPAERFPDYQPSRITASAEALTSSALSASLLSQAN